MCVFTEIKQRVSMLDVLVMYGVTVNGNSNFKCPLLWHDDSTASFHIYLATNSFFCFGCGIGGSVIDFVSAMESIEPLEACKWLDSAFGLGLFDGKCKPDTRLLEERKQAAKNINGFLAEANSVFDYLCSEYKTGEWVLKPDNRIYESKGRWLYEHYADSLNVIKYHKNGLCEALNDFDFNWAKNDMEAVVASVEAISTITSGYTGGAAYGKWFERFN